MKYYITKHCMNRYTERISNGLNVHDNLLFTILNHIGKGKDITDKVYNDVPRYILFLLEKYQETNYKIISSDNTIFIVKKRPGTMDLHDVLTCYSNCNKYLETFKTSVLTRKEIFEKIAVWKMNNKKK